MDLPPPAAIVPAPVLAAFAVARLRAGGLA